MMKIILISGALFSLFLQAQTENQIKQAKSYMQKNNISIEKAKNIAKSKGYSTDQISKVIESEKQDKTLHNRKSKPDNSYFNQDFENTESPKEIINKKNSEEEFQVKNEMNLIERSSKLNYFGYEIFKNDPELFQAAMLGLVEPNYLIGPGDEIIVMIWGETQFRQVLTVNREGFIFIPEIGQVFVNGLNLNMLESKLFKVLSQSYSSLDSRNNKATTFLDVSLGKLRPLSIQVVGEVLQPGSYTINPSATIFSSLYYFKGPTTLGSLRDIHLIRGGEKITSIDFYDFLLTGKKISDQKLQLDDVIFIPKRKKTVSIIGAIQKPAIYEIKEHEKLLDLILLAGGLKAEAYLDRAQIDRIIPFKDRKTAQMDRVLKDFSIKDLTDSNNNLNLEDGDIINIFSISDKRENTVKIDGAISRPGSYDLGDSLYLKELILKADNLLGDAYLDRADIYRIKDDLKTELIKINIYKALENDVSHNIKLKANDSIKVYSKSDMISENFVQIYGQVKNPGSYPLIENMSIYDLLFLGGSVLDSVFNKKTYLKRADLIRFDENNINQIIKSFDLGNMLKKENNSEDIILKPGDQIYVYSNDILNYKKTISVFGDINNPKNYFYKKNMNLKDIILEAGGLTKNIEFFEVDIVSFIYHESKKEGKLKKYKINDKLKLKASEDAKINSLEEIKINPYDYIFFRKANYIQKQKLITVEGEVLFPGKYSILHDKETIYDIIQRAGGLKNNANISRSTFSRKSTIVRMDLAFNLNTKNKKNNFILKDGDVITIKEKSNLVSVEGELNVPGFYEYKKGLRVSSIITNAGGLTVDANTDGIYIIYPNGRSKKYSRVFRNHKITDGSIIRVGRQKEKEPIDTTEYLKEITMIISNFVQAVSIIILARN